MDPSRWKEIKSAFSRAVEMTAEDRSIFVSSLPADIQPDVISLLNAESDAGSFIEDPFLIDQGSMDREDRSAVAGDQIDEYRLIEQIGVGGMGSVYLAEQQGEGFSQRVALKLIKRGMDTSSVLKRFLIERQILANLEHPNIARMLDGGSTPDGLPYFVMEYVKGDSIRAYCEAKNSDLKSRLRLFSKVCSAVIYAHQNLVVHRDLKPSNILVGEDGEPKLLDFGIAKVLQPDWNADNDAATATQFRVLTPEYASPEQLRGEATSTLTDVYSLGVVLYELLTGVRPFQVHGRDLSALAAAISTKDPKKPSAAASEHDDITRNDDKRTLVYEAHPTGDVPIRSVIRTATPDARALRGDLDNIVMKAIRREPERRYQSVTELLDDVDRYLKGLPVKATADSIGYRLGKFVRRHKAAVAVSAAAAALLIGTTAVTGWQYQVANAERARAERQFNETRALSKSVLYEIHDAIEQLPGSTPARELLVSKALEYLDRLAAENPTDPYLLTELADAYQRIGDLQGGMARSNLGQREKSEESYKRSFDIRRSLVDRGFSEPKLVWKLSQGYTKLAETSFQNADLDGYLENCRKALELVVPLEAELGSDPDFVIDLAAAYARFGRANGALGKADVGAENSRKAIAILEAEVEKNPGHAELLKSLSTVNDMYAEILSSFGQKAEALAYYQKSLEIGKKAWSLEPSNITYRRDVAVSYLYVSKTQCELGRCGEAVADADKALSMSKEIAASDQQNADFAAVVRAAEENKGEILVRSGRLDEAIRLLTPTLEEFERLMSADPNDKLLAFSAAGLREQLGRAHLLNSIRDPKGKNGSNEAAIGCRLLRAAFDVFKEFRDAGLTTGEEAARADAISTDLDKCTSIGH